MTCNVWNGMLNLTISIVVLTHVKCYKTEMFINVNVAEFRLLTCAGVTGSSGSTGPRGPDGQVGPAGATGPLGAEGNMGATGQPGPMGFTGPAGATGNTGDAGPSGPAGMDYHFYSTSRLRCQNSKDK